jgi:hypothetical protein
MMPTLETTGPVSDIQLEELLLTAAHELDGEGPGMAQESILLRRVAGQLGALQDIKREQWILTGWHKLFQDGKLAWGYNIDNPGPPFFHFPVPFASLDYSEKKA